MHQVEKICKASLETEFNNLLNQTGARQIQNLIDRKIITVYDYSYTGFSVDELTGGIFWKPVRDNQTR